MNKLQKPTKTGLTDRWGTKRSDRFTCAPDPIKIMEMKGPDVRLAGGIDYKNGGGPLERVSRPSTSEYKVMKTVAKKIIIRIKETDVEQYSSLSEQKN